MSSLDTWHEFFLGYQDRAKGVLPVRVRLSARAWWGDSPELLVPVDITQAM